MENDGLTIEKLKELTGNNYSDEEALEIIFSINALVDIIMDYQEEQEERAKQLDNKKF